MTTCSGLGSPPAPRIPRRPERDQLPDQDDSPSRGGASPSAICGASAADGRPLLVLGRSESDEIHGKMVRAADARRGFNGSRARCHPERYRGVCFSVSTAYPLASNQTRRRPRLGKNRCRLPNLATPATEAASARNMRHGAPSDTMPCLADVRTPPRGFETLIVDHDLAR